MAMITLILSAFLRSISFLADIRIYGIALIQNKVISQIVVAPPRFCKSFLLTAITMPETNPVSIHQLPVRSK
jgi:hypothetical protein